LIELHLKIHTRQLIGRHVSLTFEMGWSSRKTQECQLNFPALLNKEQRPLPSHMSHQLSCILNSLNLSASSKFLLNILMFFGALAARAFIDFGLIIVIFVLFNF